MTSCSEGLFSFLKLSVHQQNLPVCFKFQLFLPRFSTVSCLSVMGLFGKTPQKTPKEQVREWCGTIRKEGRVLDRQIRAIQNEEAKVKRSIKDAAKKGDKDVCRILAKEIINSRRAVNKMYASKAQLNSVEMGMKNQLATLRMAGALEKSTEVMSMMQKLIKIPQIQATMMELSKEMMKAGVIEEMLEDTFEGLEDDDLEEAADEEVEKILFEVTQGVLGEAGHVTNPLPAGAEGVAEPEPEEDLEDMQSRLEALRS